MTSTAVQPLRQRLRDALRKKFRTPQDALRALGLDEFLLDVARSKQQAGLSRDQVDLPALRAKLEQLLCEHLSGDELEQARGLLNQHLLGRSSEHDRVDDFEEDDDKKRQSWRKALATVADYLSNEKGFDEEQIKEALRDFPRNGLEHQGAALDDDLDDLMQQRRQRMAGDAEKKRQAFDARWPQAARLDGTLLETAYGSPTPTPAPTSIAASLERWPEAARIGVA